MHEFSIAANLVEKLSEFVRENPDKKIFEVRLEIGELSHIEHDQLCFCYESITKETPLEGSSLKIDKVEAFVECRIAPIAGVRNTGTIFWQVPPL
jgi:Zn finger protein HypA/HybF (possibly regulating hydrogenase expression)